MRFAKKHNKRHAEPKGADGAQEKQNCGSLADNLACLKLWCDEKLIKSFPV